MDEATLRRALERAGFTTYQAEAYLTLLDLGTVPAVEVGHKSPVPVSHVYEVLRTLEERGYVETIEREKLYAQPADPEAILGDLREQSEQLASAADAVDERYRRPELMDHRMSVIQHADTAVKHARSLIEEADTVVELAATPDQLGVLEPALRDAHARGVVVRASLYVEADAGPLDGIDPEGVITELRPCPIPGPLLVIIDRHRACFAPNVHWHEDYGVLIHDRILPFVFHWYFLTCLWNLNAPVYVEDDGASTYVTIEEFVRDFYGLWRDGYRLVVTVRGVDIETDEPRTLTGTVEGIHYSGMYAREDEPSLTDLASFTSIDVVPTRDDDQAADDQAVDGQAGVDQAADGHAADGHAADGQDNGQAADHAADGAADGGAAVPERVRVGGWGAVFEDLEMRRLDLVDIRLPDAVLP